MDAMKADDLLRWFTEELLPDLVKRGIFLENVADQSIEKCNFDEIERGVNSFASAPSFVKLVLKTNSGPISRDILVKFQCQDPEFREKMKLIPQFRNEVTMYNEILPEFGEFLKHCKSNAEMLRDIVPLCYFASHGGGNPEKSVLIMEDLRHKGYRLSDSVTKLDLKHCLLAVEKLAQFHSVSFAMKFRNWGPFEKLKNSFVHIWYSNDEWTRQQCRDFKGHCAQRGIDHLIAKENTEVPFEYLDNLKKLLEPECLFDLLREVHSPKEPLSVICHGDFNRNNVLFQYNGGKLSDAKLIDFQTFLYGSPCLDLSFFIYMNTTLEFRKKHFHKIFDHYYTTLITTISRILKEPEENVKDRLPLQLFEDEFARVAIGALVTVSFFLPVMMAPLKSSFERDLKEKTPAELARENYIQGGETASERVAEVIVDFYRRKFYT